jgi:hypothetical protein
LHLLCDLMSGEGITAVTEDDDADEAGGVSANTLHTFSISEDFTGLEHVFVAEMSYTEALEPHSLAEAKQLPDWPL